tara:strand:+ start:2381 stop:2977 length:597 start_codon:yes stop_codon:yes gene_type:complete
MSLQTIFENQESMTVNNRRMVGQQVARSGYITVAQYLTSVPWVFTVTPNNYLYYPTARAIIQAIDNKDRQLPEVITFNSSLLSWFTQKLGTATVATLNGTPTANTQTLALTSNGTFKAGDFIMVGGYTYKVTADSAGASVNIHRPLIGAPVSGAVVSIGNACTFNVVAEVCPTYTLTPMTDGAFVNWDQPFVFREYIT